MANSYIVTAEPYGKSLGLCCEECEAQTFFISWCSEGPKKWDRVAATCTECGYHNTLALPFDPWSSEDVGGVT